MRLTVLSIIIFIASAAQAQKLNRPAIEKIVKRMDSLYKKNCTSFSRNKKTSKGKLFKEDWKYYQTSSQIYFSVKHRIDSTEYKEEYYFYKNRLIYATEWETFYVPTLDPGNGTTWAGFYYFSGNKLIYEETLGHGNQSPMRTTGIPKKKRYQDCRKEKMK